MSAPAASPAADQEAPAARAASAANQGAAVEMRAVPMWPAKGDGASPPPNARASTPMRPGWSR